jgi:membrane protein DedA with SNARE-associated domain
LLLSPLLALLSVFSDVLVSSRMNDPRAAQQVTGIFVVPIIALSLVVLAGKVLLSVWMVVLAATVALALDGLVLYFAVRLFQRETILTRWKQAPLQLLTRCLHTVNVIFTRPCYSTLVRRKFPLPGHFHANLDHHKRRRRKSWQS